jgi:DNA gyrase subunit A
MSTVGNETIQERDIGVEMRSSFMDYAMSIIVSRALPDVRDGLKPVHRRILYAMYDLGMLPDKPHKKSARIVGEIIGKYHPHGDAAVYETMVRMAQDFSLRYMLVDGHGNFGSIDGDGAAAMRYTEAKLSAIAMELLRDLNKDTVDFVPNYDGQEHEPSVLPSRFPQLLVNGVSGIAVGMATNIPPHNLGEIIDALQLLIQQPDASTAQLMKHVRGPDFPTAGYIIGASGIKQAYETGRGSITMRARTHIEEHQGKQRIIVNQLPYQVIKARLIEKIAELVKDKKIDGITDLRDESDRTGMRIVIELRRDANVHVLLNNLYKQTTMQLNFGVNMLALVNGEPRLLTLRDALHAYATHQIDVVRRRTAFDLRKAQARAHILEGLRIALDALDRVIALIRSSHTTDEARQQLIVQCALSHEQAQAILDMRLQRLTGLERTKIEEEYMELQAKIADFTDILQHPERVRMIISEELEQVKTQFSDNRRTEIIHDEQTMEDSDLIDREDVLITISHTGYCKRIPVATYRAQRRGGRGMTAMDTKDDDYVEHLVVTNTHEPLLCFTNKGKAYRIMGHEIPELGRTARGTPIINILNIEQDERIQAVIPVPISEQTSAQWVLFVTKQGIVKKTELHQYDHIYKSGIIAIKLKEKDELIGACVTHGTHQVVIGTKYGQAIRFLEQDVSPTGRATTGVKGIHLHHQDLVIGMDIAEQHDDVCIVTTSGYGKRTPIEAYPLQTRGGKGVRTLHVTEKNGTVVGIKTVRNNQDIFIITQSGTVIRTKIEDVSSMGRNTQGVRLIRIRDDDFVSTVTQMQREIEPGERTAEEKSEEGLSEEHDLQ